jgi:hypothetical protein
MPVSSQAFCITTPKERKTNALFSFTPFCCACLLHDSFPSVFFGFHLFSAPSMSGLHASFTPAIGFGVGNWQPPGSQSIPNSPTRLPLLFASLQFPLASLFVQILFPFHFPSLHWIFVFISHIPSWFSPFFILTSTRVRCTSSVSISLYGFKSSGPV